MIFVKCDAVHGQPVCPLVLKAVNRALGACRRLLIKSKMAAARPNQQRQPACVAFALPHQMPHFTGYFPLQEIVSPTGNKAWHWDETRWFTVMVLIPNGPHLTDALQCFFFFFCIWKKNNYNKVGKLEGFALCSSGGK